MHPLFLQYILSLTIFMSIFNKHCQNRLVSVIMFIKPHLLYRLPFPSAAYDACFIYLFLSVICLRFCTAFRWHFSAISPVYLAPLPKTSLAILKSLCHAFLLGISFLPPFLFSAFHIEKSKYGKYSRADKINDQILHRIKQSDIKISSQSRDCPFTATSVMFCIAYGTLCPPGSSITDRIVWITVSFCISSSMIISIPNSKLLHNSIVIENKTLRLP